MQSLFLTHVCTSWQLQAKTANRLSPFHHPNKAVRICTARVLQSIFEEADDDDDPGLDMEEFRVAMRRAMGPHLSDDEIDAIFMKATTLSHSQFTDKWNIP